MKTHFKNASYKNVDAEDFLTSLGMRNITQRDNEITFSCPWEVHKFGDQNPSASMNTESKLIYCFSCKTGHNPISFLAKLENIAFVDAQKFIIERYGDGNSYDGFSLIQYFKRKQNVQDTIAETTGLNKNNPVIPWAYAEERQFKLLGEPLRYLYNRGFQRQTIEHFALGYDELSDMVVIPVCDKDGSLLGFKGRAYRAEFAGPKYLVIGDRKGNTWGFGTVNVQHEIFNHDGLINSDPIIVVEGELDAMMLWQRGYKNVCSLYGSSFTNTQKEKLLASGNDFILFLDSDPAGDKCKEKMVEELSPYATIKVVDQHEGDPCSMTENECAALIENAKSPLTNYIKSIQEEGK